MKVVAICYDFDKTLGSKGSCLDHGYLEDLNLNSDEFWVEVNKTRNKYNLEDALGYMYYTIKKSAELGKPITKEKLESYGEKLTYYNGVETWFERVNNYAKNKGIMLEHYLISSGLKEVLDKCSIAKYFKKIYACSYLYNDKNEPIWPANIVNYTSKTQYLYRIKKNILDENDPKVNDKQINKRIPFENMIYVGDSSTDIPCMSIVSKNKGHSIGIYEPKKKELMLNLFNNKRINYYCLADYSEGSEMEKTVFSIIDKIKLREKEKTKNL